jgi:hypothetical protein
LLTTYLSSSTFVSTFALRTSSTSHNNSYVSYRSTHATHQPPPETNCRSRHSTDISFSHHPSFAAPQCLDKIDWLCLAFEDPGAAMGFGAEICLLAVWFWVKVVYLETAVMDQIYLWSRVHVPTGRCRLLHP